MAQETVRLDAVSVPSKAYDDGPEFESTIASVANPGGDVCGPRRVRWRFETCPQLDRPDLVGAVTEPIRVEHEPFEPGLRCGSF